MEGAGSVETRRVSPVTPSSRAAEIARPQDTVVLPTPPLPPTIVSVRRRTVVGRRAPGLGPPPDFKSVADRRFSRNLFEAARTLSLRPLTEPSVTNSPNALAISATPIGAGS